MRSRRGSALPAAISAAGATVPPRRAPRGVVGACSATAPRARPPPQRRRHRKQQRPAPGDHHRLARERCSRLEQRLRTADAEHAGQRPSWEWKKELARAVAITIDGRIDAKLAPSRAMTRVYSVAVVAIRVDDAGTRLDARPRAFESQHPRSRGTRERYRPDVARSARRRSCSRPRPSRARARLGGARRSGNPGRSGANDGDVALEHVRHARSCRLLVGGRVRPFRPLASRDTRADARAVDRHAALVADAHAAQWSTHVVPFGPTKAPFRPR